MDVESVQRIVREYLLKTLQALHEQTLGSFDFFAASYILALNPNR
jgi:hypothetical protein